MVTEVVATVDIRMPRLTDSMTEGTIVKWRKTLGERVEPGDELAEIETDKATILFEADCGGTLLEQVAAEGESVPVGAVIARIGDAAAQRATVESNTAAGRARTRISPVARRIAEERGVDLSRVSGSGPNGRIVKADVEAAAAPAAGAASESPATPGPARQAADRQSTLVPLSRLQRTVAERMTQSQTSVPHFYLEAEIDMTRCLEGRERMKVGSGDGPVPSINDLVVKACALALRAFPTANASYRGDDQLELHARVNVGIAVAAEATLLVPTIFDADRKGLAEIAAESRALAERARTAAITPAELDGGTFTVSNLGMFGVRSFLPLVNPPQAAILACGAVGAARRMAVTLACDHRVLYGADAAAFLQRIRAQLEEPLSLAI